MRTITAALLLIAGLNHAQAENYTWISPSLSNANWSVPGAWSPNGTPGSGDNVITSPPAGFIYVDGNSRTVANWTQSGGSANFRVLGLSGLGGTTLTITGTLTKGGSSSLIIRNSSGAANPLDLSVGHVALSGGNLAFGEAEATSFLSGFTAGTATVTGGALHFKMGATSGTATITGALNLQNSGTVSLRYAPSQNGESGLLSVGSLTSPSVTAVIEVNNASAYTTSGTLALKNAAGSTTYSGIIRNGGTGTSANTLSVTKDGEGIQVFSGENNTYSGTTTVNAGTLLINGTQTGGGDYTVNNGGKLGGTGSIGLAANRNVSILSGGALIASSADSLSFSLTGLGELDISGALIGATSMFFTLDAPESTVISLSGGLNIGTGILNFNDFSFVAGGGFGEGTYTLFGGANALTGTLGSNLSGLVSGKFATIGLSGNDVVLSVVPEPGACLLLIGGLAVALRLRRRG